MQKDHERNATVKRYDVETVRIESEIKGDFLHGRETLLFTDWGMHSRHESDTEEEDGVHTKGISIADADFSYAFGKAEYHGKGYKSKIDRPAWRSDSGLDYSAWLAKNFESQGLKFSGTRVFAGKTCDVWKQGVMTMYVWKGLMLYFESSTPDGKQKSITEAVKIDEHPAIAKDAFTVPANIKFEEY